jgi:hypothetical protein
LWKISDEKSEDNSKENHDWKPSTKLINKSKNWQSPDDWKLVKISPDEEIESLVYIENVTNNYFLAVSDNGNDIDNKEVLAENNGE